MSFNVTAIVSAESLNKDNFFTLATDKFPQAVGRFQQWLMVYAEKVKWESLFGNRERVKEYGNGHNDDYFRIKFENLPLEMQIGILFSFFRSENAVLAVQNGAEILQREVQIQAIINCFSQLESDVAISPDR